MLTLLAAATKATPKQGSWVPSMVMALAFFGVYWFYLRPRNKKMREQRTQGRQFEIGDEIQTIGGLIATVTGIDGDVVTVKTAGGQALEFTKRAIGGKFVRPSAEPEAPAAEETTEQ